VRTRLLDKTPVTVVGCGDVRLATAAARGIDAREATMAISEALDGGIRLVDVADEPDAERACGDAIRALRLRDAVVLASRVPALAPLPGRPDRDVLPERLPARYVQERVEATLRATKLDVIPLVQLAIAPAWRTSPAWAEVAGTCNRLAREGKVMQWAAYLDVLDDANALDAWLVAFNVEFSACRRVELDRPLLARHPLAGGALAGALGPGVQLARLDDRRALDDTMLERFAVIAAKLAPLVKVQPAAATSCDAAKAVLDKNRRTLDVEAATIAELALRYVCDRAIALPRLHRRQHLAEAITSASAPPLSQAMRDRIDEVLANSPT
jgi:aryl-alcohol dehydrogenase-like predicted oxidoreductase